jgi:hypothetical protein
VLDRVRPVAGYPSPAGRPCYGGGHLNSKLVGGTGHYLNFSAEYTGGLLELLRNTDLNC